MTQAPASALLRRGLLDGVMMMVAGEGAGEEVGEACRSLGAKVGRLPARALDGEDLDLSLLLEPADAARALVVDVAGLAPATRGSAEGSAALGVEVDRTWAAVRAVATGALIPAAGGKVILLAPRRGEGPRAGGVRAAVENLARTLSVEWARHKITVVAVMPGEHAGHGEVAALTAYLLSRAGDYFSGCRLELAPTR